MRVAISVVYFSRRYVDVTRTWQKHGVDGGHCTTESPHRQVQHHHLHAVTHVQRHRAGSAVAMTQEVSGHTLRKLLQLTKRHLFAADGVNLHTDSPL